MQEMSISINELTPELKAELERYDDLDLVVLLDDEDVQELRFQEELDELEL